MRRRRSSALSTMSRPKRVAPECFCEPRSNRRNSSSECARSASLAVWMPNCAQQPLRRMVQQPDEGIREPGKPRQRLRGPKRDLQRLADGDRLGHQFADDNQQKTVDEKSGRRSPPCAAPPAIARATSRTPARAAPRNTGSTSTPRPRLASVMPNWMALMVVSRF